MFKFFVMTAVLLSAPSAYACGADAGNCYRMQSGATYEVSTRPVERYVTDCAPGVNCHHMQSGQHYSVQRPTQ